MRDERGFSRELLIAIVIISFLSVIAFNRVLALRFEAERMMVQSVVTGLLSALYIDFAAAAANGVDYGDYVGQDAHAGKLYTVWADNSNCDGTNANGTLSAFDLYTNILVISSGTPSPSPTPTRHSPSWAWITPTPCPRA